MTLRVFGPLMLAVFLAVVACGGDDEPDVTATPDETTPPASATLFQPPGSSEAIAAAIEALGTWLEPVGDASAITAVAVEAVTWPNGCLGLQRVGVACTEALVEGFQIDLGLGFSTYEVRTDLGGDVVVWAPGVQALVFFKEARADSIQFTTDDGGVVEAQPVSGTDYGVDLDSLAEGDPVGVGLANAPESGGSLLIWLDPVSE